MDKKYQIKMIIAEMMAKLESTHKFDEDKLNYFNDVVNAIIIDGSKVIKVEEEIESYSIDMERMSPFTKKIVKEKDKVLKEYISDGEILFEILR